MTYNERVVISNESEIGLEPLECYQLPGTLRDPQDITEDTYWRGYNDAIEAVAATIKLKSIRDKILDMKKECI